MVDFSELNMSTIVPDPVEKTNAKRAKPITLINATGPSDLIFPSNAIVYNFSIS